jgi:transcriptional regulator with XRE-family HTH domain
MARIDDSDEDESGTEKAFEAAIRNRIRSIRESRGWTQKQVATWLGIGEERYKKYEQRSMMSPYMQQKFCELTGTSLEFLITGTPPGRHPARIPR